MVYKGFTLVGELGLAPTLFTRKRASTCYSLRICKASERTDAPMYQGEKINLSYLMAIRPPPPRPPPFTEGEVAGGEGAPSY
jgi:hypothetical protein